MSELVDGGAGGQIPQTHRPISAGKRLALGTETDGVGAVAAHFAELFAGRRVPKTPGGVAVAPQHALAVRRQGRVDRPRPLYAVGIVADLEAAEFRTLVGIP